MRPRDSQRSKVYAAETRAIGSKVEFETVAECQEFVDKVTRSRWWKSCCHPNRVGATVLVEDGRARRSAAASYSRWAIYLPHYYRERATILHQLAHLLNRRRGAVHGPEFCALLLELVKRFMGPEDAAKLKAEFKRTKVKHRRPYKKADADQIVQHL